MEKIIDVFGIDWRLLAIQAVNFGIVLFVLQVFLYKPIMKMLDDRKAKIAKGVKDAEEAGVKLANAEADAKKIVGAAEREARDTELLAKKAAEEKAAEIMHEAEAKRARELEEAKREAAEAKARAIAESQEEIGRLAILAAEKILKAKS
jgi:F-type H+-transporting ATPase subunit b